MKSFLRISLFCLSSLAAYTLSACSTVTVPASEFLEFPEIQSDGKQIGEYPSLASLPPAPDDLRSAKQWDSAARELLDAGRVTTLLGSTGPEISDAQIVQEINNLKAQAQEYKLEDPQGEIQSYYVDE